jgi:NAD dependent epimerase/dehydratase family enzyme
VTRDWQDAAQPAVEAGARVCVLRTVPVIDRRGAPLKQLLPLFKAGLGARLGSGDQYMPMISLRDWVAAASFLAIHDDISGPVNLCCAQTPTNAEFTAELGRLVHRPTVLTVPAAVLRPATGRLAPELLGSVRAVPRVLLDAGFAFADPTVSDVLGSALARHD